MSEEANLVKDLALILISAGVFTIISKALKQPLILGYIVAGFLVGPHMGLFPTVSSTAEVKEWSDIGIIFLLFALGLEFSFKKLIKVGSSALITAMTQCVGMFILGFLVGEAIGWSNMESIFLGGMLSMSSTTIIFKAFDDMGLRHERFAGLVLSVLIIEDILAIVLMVMLSTLAVSKEFEGSQMLTSILQLGFFLILWFAIGIYLIPLFLKKAKPLLNEETLLITALALCFGMVVFASAVGFSAAFGAFVMGSILAETTEAKQIEHLVAPVKNLFGAVFFVSVGMMVDVALIIEYIVPILCIIVAIMLGQTILSTCGFLLSGQSLKTAMKCSYSLTQIGEFAFILATLGTSLHVTSDFLYPIVVAVSVFTTFTTPYMIRLAEPAYNVVARVLPAKWITKLERNVSEEAEEHETNEMHQLWRSEFKRYVFIVLINSVLCLAVIAVMYYYGAPLIYGMLPAPWSGIVTAFFTLSICGPFLWSLMRQGGNSDNVNRLWYEGGRNERVKITAFAILRLVIAAAIIAYIIGNTLPMIGMYGIFAVIAVACFIFMSPSLEKRSDSMTKTFTDNLNKREQNQ